MHVKVEYYATLWVTDNFLRGVSNWHTTITVAQLLNQGDLYKNIANAINLNYQRQCRKAESEQVMYRDPVKEKVLITNCQAPASTGDTEWHGAAYRGCLLVKLLLDPSQVGFFTEQSYQDKNYLASPIRASDIYGIYANQLVSNYKFKLFLIQPDASTLAANEIAVFKEDDIFYYMLKDDEVPMPVTDFAAANADYPPGLQFREGAVKSAMDYMYNHGQAGATLAGRSPTKAWLEKRGQQGLIELLGFVAAIGKIDPRVHIHGQLEPDFPFNETREVGYAYQNAPAPYGFFVEAKEEKKEAIQEEKKEGITDPFACPLTGERLVCPVVYSKDKKTYSEGAITKRLEAEGYEAKDLIVADRLAAGFIANPEMTDVEAEELLLCPITQEVIQDPHFCTLDGYTYEKDAIVDWLRRNPTSPITRAEIPAGKRVEDVLFPHPFAKAMLAELQQKQVQQSVFRY